MTDQPNFVGADLISLVVTRDEVESGDISRVLTLLRTFLTTPAQARARRGTLDMRFDGYNDDPAELFEIEEVRAFVHELDLQFPYWLYFSNVHTLSLRALVLCFLPPYLTAAGKAEHFADELNALLQRRWRPAFDEVAAFAGHSQAEYKEILDATLGYFGSRADSMHP